MKRGIILAAALSLISAAGVNVSVPPLNAADSPKEVAPGAVSKVDGKFAIAAAMGNLSEIAMGKLALTNGVNEDVRKFAQKMIDDHTQANQDLGQAVAGKDIKLPTELDEKNKTMLDGLRVYQGEIFDREYIAHMVADHRADVKEFEQAVEQVKSAELKAYAEKMLPILRKHEKAATEIQRALTKTASDY